MKLHRLPILLILALLMTTIPVFAADISDVEIVAIVNDRVITLAEFYETMEREVGTFVLAQMIFREVVQQKQQALGITIDQQEMEAYLTRKSCRHYLAVGRRKQFPGLFGGTARPGFLPLNSWNSSISSISALYRDRSHP